MNGFVRNLRGRAFLMIIGTTTLIWGVKSLSLGMGALYPPKNAPVVASISIGRCALSLPKYAAVSRVGAFQMPDAKAQSCPPSLLHSLSLKARLQCASHKSLVGVPGVGKSAAERIIRAMDSKSWEGLKSKARLNIQQLRGLQDRFVIHGEVTACSS